MTTAQVTTPNDPAEILDIVFRVCHRLRDHHGVTITLDDLHPDTIADWHSASRTLTVRRTADLAEQYYVYRGLVDLLLLGPDAVPGAIPVRPKLHLVPAPRFTAD